MKKQWICIVGASGSGKSTLVEHVKRDGSIVELISHTTRAPREKDNEIDGVHYYFVSDEEFDKIEKIEESPYSGQHRYCISVDEMNNKFEKHSKIVSIVDINGATQIKEYCKDKDVVVKVVYIKTNLEIMEARMRNRGDSEESIKKRIDFAKESNELSNDKFADYVIDNTGTLEDSIKQLKEILL